jgi:hypothetical protein
MTDKMTIIDALRGDIAFFEYQIESRDYDIREMQRRNEKDRERLQTAIKKLNELVEKEIVPEAE